MRRLDVYRWGRPGVGQHDDAVRYGIAWRAKRLPLQAFDDAGLHLYRLDSFQLMEAES